MEEWPEYLVALIQFVGGALAITFGPALLASPVLLVIYLVESLFS